MSYPIPNPANPLWKVERNKDWCAAGKPNFERFAATWQASKDIEPKLLLTKAYRRYLADKQYVQSVMRSANG